MGLPEIVSPERWRAARVELLAEEKAITRARDALNAKRRMLPMVLVEKDYILEGPDGKASLLDLFAGRRQLIVDHFMFDPSWDDGCPGCSADAAERSQALLDQLATRDTALVSVSRAPLHKIQDYKARKGWTFPWFSSYGSDFNFDFRVTIDESVVPLEINYRTRADLEREGLTDRIEGDQPYEIAGLSCFLRDDDRVFHTYSTYGRGDEVGGAYFLLDLTALGRQESWEEPKDRASGDRGPDPSFTS